MASAFRGVVGSQFDLIGFDPRGTYIPTSSLSYLRLPLITLTPGVGFTTPSLSVFTTDHDEQTTEPADGNDAQLLTAPDTRTHNP